MAKQRKSTHKQNNRKFTDDKLNIDIVGIVFLAFGILSLLSLSSLKMGIVGSIINGTTFALMGFGGYFLPLFVIATGIILLLKRFDKIQLKVIIALAIIFISFLVVLDSINIGLSGIFERIKLGLELGSAGRGGGLIGSFFGFFFYKLFGTTGTYIVLAFAITACIMIITNLTVKEMLAKAKSIKMPQKLILRNHNENQDESNSRSATGHVKNPDTIFNDDKKLIRISDYKNTENLSQPKDITETNKEPVRKISREELEKESKNITIEIQDKQVEHVKIYKKPPLSLLTSPSSKKDSQGNSEILSNARKIEETMKNFGIEAKISHINVGPTITCYELSPAPGIRLSRIVSLSDNIALSLSSSDIRIEAPIPGRDVVGIEVPNKSKDMVLFKELITSKDFLSIDSEVPLVLGKDNSGKVIISSIDKMPHLLIAGATGSGKSVCINTIIMSLLYKSSPEDVKLLLIDPKVVELSVYNGIPHLLIPVVTDAKKSAYALNWAVSEMERRYKIFATNHVRDIKSYREKMKSKEDKLPKIVIIIDELADLMMVAAQEIEEYIARLAQMARAAGIYLIVATQRPSVDVITGTIKANIPSRISFATSSQVDSRTILDMSGAEKLLGQGDMLFYPSTASKPKRLQGAFISNKEVEDVVEFLKGQNTSNYDEEIIEVVQNSKPIDFNNSSDDLLEEAINLVVQEGTASISMLQRKLKIGYSRAGRLIDDMEERGIVSGYEGSKPRKVLLTQEDLEE